MNKAWWLGVLCCLSAVWGCSKDKTEPAPAGQAASQTAAAKPAPAKVKLALDWVPEPEFGGFYAARENGTFAQPWAGGGDPGRWRGRSGGPDGGRRARRTSAPPARTRCSTARARGVDVVPLFAVYQTTPHAIMAHASRGAHEPGTLFSSGSTVALEPGLAYAQFLKKKYGFDKVKIVPYDGGVARFLADKEFAQQCFLTSEPLAAKKQGGDPVVFKMADEGFNPYATVVVTRGELLKQHPERVRAFVDAVREGWRAYLDDPEPANDVMAKLNTTMDAGDLRRGGRDAEAAHRDRGDARQGAGRDEPGALGDAGQQLVELGVIEKAPPVDEYLRPEFLGAPASTPAAK